MGSDLASALVDLLAWLTRAFVAVGSIPAADSFWSSNIYLLGLLTLPFGAARQLRAGRWLLALPLIVLELYFIHNRLTLLSGARVTWASLSGNVALFTLGAVFLLPDWVWYRHKEAD